jgi:DNA polymerase-3 subunit gamma/tau
MATQALYRKWRPRTFDEVVGQEHVTRTLRNALAGDRVTHAYLFAGPRGTGKTTTARLLARAVNCVGDSENKPCGACRICRAVDEGRLIDLIEIDAASNRGIDEIRDLRDKVGFRPGEARFKFYIIDEVHMLTEPAFNALLKTLEEPPPHVIFVLATTEPHKIPATIVSRCQRFDFRRIPLADITRWLGHIAAEEGLTVEPAALEYIARQGGGSLRDSISLLDQLTVYGGDAITLSQVQSVLGAVASRSVVELAECLIRNERARGLELINRSIGDGAEPRQFTREMVEHLRKLLLLRMGDGTSLLYANTTEEELAAIQIQAKQVSPRWLLRAIRLFNTAAMETKTSFLPQLSLELAFLEAVSEEAAAESAPTPPVSPTPQKLPALPGAEPPPSVAAMPRATPPAYTTPTPPIPPVTAREISNEISRPLVVPGETGNVTFDLLKDNWRIILTNLRQVDKMAQGLMNSVALVGVEGNEVIVEAPSELIKGRIEPLRIRSQVEACIGQVVGMPMRLRCVSKGEYRSNPVPLRTDLHVAAPDQANDSTQALPQAQSPAVPNGGMSVPAEEMSPDDDPIADEVLKLGGVRNYQK